jgi:phage terminase large subunit
MTLAPIDAYITAAKAAGCPPDQIERFIRAGIVLQPRQLEASAAARRCDAEGGPTDIGYGGARGGGKSHWGMAQVGADDCQRYPDLKVLVLRKVGKSLREGVTDMLRRVLGGLDYHWAPSEQTVYFPNGSRMLLGHFQKESDIDAYLGLEYDLILIEEATTLSASKRKAIMTCLRTSKPGWRPRAYTTTNPGGVGHQWYKAAIVDPHRQGAGYLPWHAQAGATRYIPATVDDNAFVNAEYSGQLSTLTGWQLRAWRYGDWDIAAGQYFTNFRRDIHVIKPFAGAVPKNWTVWAAMDYGWTHYTVIQLFAEGDGNVIILDEHAAREWVIERHVRAFGEMLRRNGVALSRLKTFVAGGDVFHKRPEGATVAGLYKQHGTVLRRANDDRTNGWSEMLNRFGDVEAHIAPTLFITERCPRLIEAIPALQHDPHNPEDVHKWDTDEDGNGGDDPADCGRYGVMAAHRRKMRSARVDLHAPASAVAPAIALPARSDDEIERILNEAA